MSLAPPTLYHSLLFEIFFILPKIALDWDIDLLGLPKLFPKANTFFFLSTGTQAVLSSSSHMDSTFYGIRIMEWVRVRVGFVVCCSRYTR